MSGFRDRARAEIEAGPPAATLSPILRKLVADSQAQLATASPADARARAEAARAYAVAHLDELQEQLRESCERQGTGYHRAADAAEAVAIVSRLLGDSRRIAKSKSMVAEEVGLTGALRLQGREVLETDIGEYIVDIEGRGPSHITAPALHLNRARIRELLAGAGADVPDDDPVRLSRTVRDVVAEFFAEVDAGITGANAVIASSGRIVIVENEGNVSLGVSRPRLHIAITGMEKVVADEEGALAVLQVLAPSATAQPLTAYTHFLGGPEEGRERHLVIVDNGRSAILADERYRDVLRCIRCGACMNACPVYTAAGGLSYGSPYMGPIGAVVSPLLWPDGRHDDLPSASSLCGRCTEVCPVGIPPAPHAARPARGRDGERGVGGGAAGVEVVGGRLRGEAGTRRQLAGPPRAARGRHPAGTAGLRSPPPAGGDAFARPGDAHPPRRDRGRTRTGARAASRGRGRALPRARGHRGRDRDRARGARGR